MTRVTHTICGAYTYRHSCHFRSSIRNGRCSAVRCSKMTYTATVSSAGINRRSSSESFFGALIPAAGRNLVVSLNQPGGNVTGIDLLTATNEPKRLGLVRDLVPHAATVRFL